MSLLLLVALAQPAVGPVVAPPPLPPIPKAAPVSVGTKDLFLVQFDAPEAPPGAADDPHRMRWIAQTIRSHRGALAACYESMLKSRQIVGRAAIAIVVGPDGRVASTQVASNEVTDKQVAPCLARVLRRLRLPPSADGFTVTLPFTFVPTP